MIENVEAELISMWRVSLQHFAQVIGFEIFQMWNVRLITFPVFDDLGESS